VKHRIILFVLLNCDSVLEYAWIDRVRNLMISKWS